LAGPLQGQSVRAFGQDPGDFAKDFSKHLTELVGKKEVEPILAAFEPYFLDPTWDGDDAQREAFMRVAREMLRRRVVTTEPWLELVQLFQTWSWPAGHYEQGQSDRFFLALEREFKRASRKEMETFLHTYQGLSDATNPLAIRLYDDGQLSWWYLDGLLEVSPANDGDTTLFRLTEGRLLGRMKQDSIEVAEVELLYNPTSATSILSCFIRPSSRPSVKRNKAVSP